MWGVIAATVLAAQATPASERLIDPSKPPVLVEALREAGYKAELKTNDKGEPYIVSAANGSSFTIELYGCKGVTDCGSMQFYNFYKKDPFYTIALANEWNANKRFVRISIDKDGDLAMWMDVTAGGKMTQGAFADWVEWYTVMDADLDKFLVEKRAAAEKSVAAGTPARK